MKYKTIFLVLIPLIFNISCVTTYSQKGIEKIKVCRISKRLRIENDSVVIKEYEVVRKLYGLTFAIIANPNEMKDSIVFGKEYLFYNQKPYLSNSARRRRYSPTCSGLIRTNK